MPIEFTPTAYCFQLLAELRLIDFHAGMMVSSFGLQTTRKLRQFKLCLQYVSAKIMSELFQRG